MNKLFAAKSNASDIIANNLKTKIFHTRSSYGENLSKIITFLEENELSISEIHKSAKDTALQLYSPLRSIFIVDDYNKSRYIRQIIIIVAKERERLNNRLNISLTNKDLCSMISMYFASITFMYAIEFSKYLDFHPSTLVAIFFAPIIEEVGNFLHKDFAHNNFYMSYRYNLRLLFLDLYTGMYKYNISDIAPAMKILYNTYNKLLKNIHTQGVLKISSLDTESNHDISITYLVILLAGFIPEIENKIFKISDIFESLLQT